MGGLSTVSLEKLPITRKPVVFGGKDRRDTLSCKDPCHFLEQTKDCERGVRALSSVTWTGRSDEA